MGSREWITEQMDAEVASLDVDTPKVLREVNVRARRRRTRRATLRAGAAAVVLAAVAGVSIDALRAPDGVELVAAPSPSTGPTTTEPTLDDAIMTESRPGLGVPFGHIEGVLEFDADRRCPALRRPGGDLTSVVWPQGWSIGSSVDGEPALRDENGTVVAVAGDRLSGAGGFSGGDHPFVGHECDVSGPWFIAGVEVRN